MRLRTITSAAAFVISLAAVTPAAAASYVAVFPIQEGSSIPIGEADYVKQTGLITARMAATAAAEVPVDYEVKRMSKWQRRYKNYLADASYILSSIQAGSTIYVRGMECLVSLSDLAKAISDNPIEGLPSTALINNSLLETAVEFVKVFRTLRGICTKSGIEGMANGEERTTTLWNLEADLARLNTRIVHLTNSIRWYRMVDVFWHYTLPYGMYSHKQIAEKCFDDWQRRVWDKR